MRRTWSPVPTALAAALFVFWVSPGCERTPDSTVEDRDSSDSAWPEGWLVVQHEEWIPVLDELGRSLHSARGVFQNGDRTAAISEIQRGIVFLETQTSAASARDRASIESAISTLRTLKARLSSGDDVSLEQLDIAFVNAYRSDMAREALVVQTGSAVPYLDRPEAHLKQAVVRFQSYRAEEAANEIDKAAAYLHLEANRLDLLERAQLVEAAQDLEHTAARLRLDEIRDFTELDRVFEPVVQQWRLLARAPTLPQSLGLAP